MGSSKAVSDNNSNLNNPEINFVDDLEKEKIRNSAIEKYLVDLHQNAKKHQEDAAQKKVQAIKYYVEHKEDVKKNLKIMLWQKCEQAWRSAESSLRTKNYNAFLKKTWELHQFSSQVAWDLEEDGKNPSPDAIGKVTDKLAEEMNRINKIDIGNRTRHHARVLYEAINSIVTENGDEELTRIAMDFANSLCSFSKADAMLREQMDSPGFVPPKKELAAAKQALRECIAHVYCEREGCQKVIKKLKDQGKPAPETESKRKQRHYHCLVKPPIHEEQKRCLLNTINNEMLPKIYFESGAKKAIALLAEKQLALSKNKDMLSRSKAKLLGEVTELLIKRLNEQELRPSDFQYLRGLQRNSIVNEPVLSQYWLIQKVQQVFHQKTGTRKTIDNALNTVCEGIQLAKRTAMGH